MKEAEIDLLYKAIFSFPQSESGDKNRRFCEDTIQEFISLVGSTEFRRLAGGILVAIAQPEKALPSQLKHYEFLVHGAIALFLSLLPVARLQDALIRQALLPPDCSSEERCVHLALCFPTLHKLGQIIVRHHPSHSDFYHWLVRLEDSGQMSSYDLIKRHIETELKQFGFCEHVKLADAVLAQASVAAVIPFTCQKGIEKAAFEGVFKVLKPNMLNIVEEELIAIRHVADHLEKDTILYGLEQMQTSELFSELRGTLKKEVDLAAEQKNLQEATSLYQKISYIRIPELTTLCTPTMTGMERIRGKKIDELQLSSAERLQIARKIFTALICIPLFSSQEITLFHGDPHAGNLLIEESDTAESTLVLIDWTLVGRLSKAIRINIIALMLAIVTKDSPKICHTISSMTQQTKYPVTPDDIKENVSSFLTSSSADNEPLIQAFRLLEKLNFAGILFPSDLILFRKTLFTLEGVLDHLCQSFSMEQALKTFLASIFIEEMPLRMTNLLAPVLEKRQDYRSLLTNEDVTRLFLHSLFDRGNDLAAYGNSLFQAQINLSLSLFSCFNPLISH